MPNTRPFRCELTLLLGVFAILIFVLDGPAAFAQRYAILHNFTGGSDGAFPDASLTLDEVGNIYGAALSDGIYHAGTIFRLAKSERGARQLPLRNEIQGVDRLATYQNDTWVFSLLYSFQGGQDGAIPEGGLTFGPNGKLYGTTDFGGGLGGLNCYGQGCGTIFSLQAPPVGSRFHDWTEDILYRFTGGSDGGDPGCKPAFDSSGNLYGTAGIGGNGCSGSGCGTVYQLTKNGQSWSFNLIHAFTGGNDGWGPNGGVTINSSGGLFGVTGMGGNGGCQYGCGTVYEFSSSGSGWSESILHAFSDGAGVYPSPGVVLADAGNIYGGTLSAQNGGNMGGVVFELSQVNGNWTYTELFTLPSDAGGINGLTMDSAGNLYGTTSGGVSNYGSVFKLTNSGEGWTYTVLHEFRYGRDGQDPIVPVVVDPDGNIYGVTNMGGAFGYGVVFEIMQ